MGDKIRFQFALKKSNSDIFVNLSPIKMNKLAALSALVLLAQLINASPVAETSEAERAIDSLTFVSKSGPERQDRERRAAAARSGLKCYNQEGSSARMELECDWLGGADYCAKVTGPNVSAKTCAIEMITDAFKELSLTSSGCRTHGDYTFCLCSTNLCNA